MSELISDGGAEIGVAWTDSGGAQRTDLYAAHSGSWSHYLFASRGGILGTSQGTRTQTIVTTPGIEAAVSLWVNPDNAVAGRQILRASVDIGSGFVTLGELETTDVPAGWSLWDLGTVIPTGASTVFEMRSLIPPGAEASGAWLTDDVSVATAEDADVSRLKDIRDAMVTRLATITIANGYDVDVASVKAVDADRTVEPKPLLIVLADNESKEKHTFDRKLSSARFEVEVWTAGETPDDDGYDVAAAVEKCLETPVGALSSALFLGVSGVEDVIVRGTQSWEATDATARGLRLKTVDVEVIYTHARRTP